MAKYEIMLIVDPKEDFETITKLVKENLSDPKIEKMDRTELAYEINKSKTAMYVLINDDTTGDKIKELTRKININKKIWRMLSINLDTEIGREDGIRKLAKRRAAYVEYKKEMTARREARDAQYKSNQQEKTEK